MAGDEATEGKFRDNGKKRDMFFFHQIIIPLELTNAAALSRLIFTSKLAVAACAR